MPLDYSGDISFRPPKRNTGHDARNGTTAFPAVTYWRHEARLKSRSIGRKGPRVTLKQVHILLVDDDLADALLAQECFRKTDYPITLHHVDSGERCLDFLHKKGEYTAAPTPDLILLDINMPRMSGHQLMEEMMADEGLRHLPVIVLTTSSSDTDVLPMLQRRCNSYITKPHDLPTFQRVIRGLCDYWFGLPGLITST